MPGNGEVHKNMYPLKLYVITQNRKYVRTYTLTYVICRNIYSVIAYFKDDRSEQKYLGINNFIIIHRCFNI